MTDNEMIDLYGPAASKAEHSRGDRIRYTDREHPKATGVIVWISAPSKERSMQYVVEPEHRSGFPDFIAPGDVLEVLNASPSLNQVQLLEFAHSAIAQSRVEKWTQEKAKRVAIAACVRYVEKHGGMSDQAQATIEAVVDEAMNTEPAMVRCPYCLQWHDTHHVAQCPLRS